VLHFSTVAARPVELQITDMRGAVILRETLKGNSGAGQYILPETPAPGVYMVRLQSGGEKKVLKWIRE
jgi:hypothetical protein